MEAFLGTVLTFGLIIGVIWLVYSATQVIKNARLNSHVKKEIRLQEQYDMKVAVLYTATKDLNTDYMLGLDDYAFEKILDCSSIKEIAKCMSYYMDKEPITLDVFRKNIACRSKEILRSSGLSPEEQEEIFAMLEVDLYLTNEETLEGIKTDFSKNIPESFGFLRGKINYTLASLGLLKALADDIDNVVLQNHIENIRRKRGLIDS